MNNKVNEIWRAIKEYPNYEVSNQGRVRNIKTHRILTPNLNNTGRYFVSLCKDNEKPKQILIHRLVAEAFVEITQSYLDKGYSQESLDVHHNDYNPLNNASNNLQWITRKEHLQIHKALCVVGYNHESMIITNCIRKMDTYYNENYPNGFNHGNISNACNGRYKSANGYKWEYLTKDLYNLLKRFAQINNKIIVIE